MTRTRPGHDRRRGWHPSRAGAIPAAAAAAVLVTACSGTGGGPRVASIDSSHPAGAGSTMSRQAQSDQVMIDFARCMRAHGVQIPDPVHLAGHAGLSVEVPPHTTATGGAWAACGHFAGRIAQLKAAGVPRRAAPPLQALTNYARCMRGHDVSMLDPTPQGQLALGDVPGISSSFGRYSPQFRAADASCRHFLPAGVSDNGTGP